MRISVLNFKESISCFPYDYQNTNPSQVSATQSHRCGTTPSLPMHLELGAIPVLSCRNFSPSQWSSFQFNQDTMISHGLLA